MTDKIFVDSNVWLYIFLQDDADKSNIAKKFILDNIDTSIFITYQVVNEVTNQLLRKKFSEKTIRNIIEYMYEIATIHNFSKEVMFLASSLREKHNLSMWDSLIVASALNFNCSILASEDMHDGLILGNMTIKNIFK
ncbi:MAG: PIN domain-containing protein [Chitinispirillia bacterium]|nr:PIN domain-containing protein [Chitinispirillia bacterium]